MLTTAQVLDAFNDLAGDAQDIAGDTEKIRWFNEGVQRLGRQLELTGDLAWDAGDTEMDLPSNFISVSMIQYDANVAPQAWRVWGLLLLIDNPYGATAAGTGTLRYWGYFGELDSTNAADFLLTTLQEDNACINYALHRFYRKLASDRVQFTRYSTLLGANAISVSDLQNEADRLYQDFIDARADTPPPAPSGFYGG